MTDRDALILHLANCAKCDKAQSGMCYTGKCLDENERAAHGKSTPAMQWKKTNGGIERKPRRRICR